MTAAPRSQEPDVPALPAEPFPALVLEKTGDAVAAVFRDLTLDDLPPGEVVIEVAYSSLNYKDGLAVTDRGRIVKGYPIVPGIDLAGTVVASSVADFRPGDAAIVTGRGIGEEHWGGYGRYARVQAEWIVRPPPALSLLDAMTVGTAGYTAMLAVMTLEEHGVAAGDGEVAVTGAAGGVGSFAVALAAAAGHRVVASTGRAEAEAYLRALGAAALVPRSELAAPPRRALGSARWAGAVDTVGGTTLASLIATMRRHGTVASCGLAGGAELHTTVYPFILRGVNLMGVDSNYCPRDRRQRAWDRLARDLAPATLERVRQAVVPLADVPRWAEAILAGEVRGRVVVALGD